MVGEVNSRGIIDSIVPHAVVAGDQRGDNVGRCKERVAAISGIRGGHTGREGQTRKREIRDCRIIRIRRIDCDVGIAASRSQAQVRGTSNVIHASAAG